MKKLYEVLVPTMYGDTIKPIRTKHHKEWDKKVQKITGGLTILSPGKGKWTYQGVEYPERVIPVRIMCTEEEIWDIVHMTIEHYRQTAVMHYLVSDYVHITYAKNMNLLTKNLDKLEELPKHDPIAPKDTPKCERWRHRGYWHQAYSHTRIGRWLESNVGRPWDDVISEYVKLPWVPAQNRTYSHLANYAVETNTQMLNGEVAFFYKYNYLHNNLRLIKDEIRKMLYVHPVKRTLEIFVPKGKKARHEEWAAKKPKEFAIINRTNQLYKEDGIWYHVWLEGYAPKNEWCQHRTIDFDRSFMHQDIKDCHVKIGEKQRIQVDHYNGKRYVYWEPIYRTVPAPKVCKKQADSKLLKRCGLKNDPKPIKYGRLK